jgi:hypothetical protein
MAVTDSMTDVYEKDEKVHSRLALLSYYFFQSHKNFSTALTAFVLIWKQ